MAADIKVFICYAREDSDIAQRLYADLERAGVTPWMDTEDLKPDQEWHIMINSVIKESSYVIALLSSHSLSKRGYVQQELKKALDVLDELPISDIFVIPARLDDCQPMDERLQNLYWVDLFPTYEAGLQQILRVVLPERRQSKAEVTPPSQETPEPL
jgi:hypothetical protein